MNGFWIVWVVDQDGEESNYGPFFNKSDAERWTNRDDVIDWSDIRDHDIEYVNDITPDESWLDHPAVDVAIGVVIFLAIIFVFWQIVRAM